MCAFFPPSAPGFCWWEGPDERPLFFRDHQELNTQVSFHCGLFSHHLCRCFDIQSSRVSAERLEQVLVSKQPTQTAENGFDNCLIRD